MKSKLYNFVANKILGLLDLFELSLKNPDNFLIVSSPQSEDIRYLSYLMPDQTVVVKLKLSQGRGLPAFKWGESSNHPFVLATQKSVKNSSSEGESKHEINQVLTSYYKTVCPPNLSCFLEGDCSDHLRKYPAWAILMPWESLDIKQWVAHIEKTVVTENSYFGTAATIEVGWAWLGPVDSVKCGIETDRLYRVLSSITKSGYKRSNSRDGDIIADILIDEEGHWVWQSITGQHRVAVLSGLEYDECFVRIRSLVRKEDVEVWPNVRNGFYTKNEALEIFGSVFNGKFPSLAQNWESYIKTIRVTDR